MPAPPPKFLLLSAAVSFLLATGAYVMAWKTADIDYVNSKARTQADKEANRGANTYGIVGLVMLGVGVGTLALYVVAKRRARLATRPS